VAPPPPPPLPPPPPPRRPRQPAAVAAAAAAAAVAAAAAAAAAAAVGSCAPFVRVNLSVRAFPQRNSGTHKAPHRSLGGQAPRAGEPDLGRFGDPGAHYEELSKKTHTEDL
jgi:hypothetical protein